MDSALLLVVLLGLFYMLLFLILEMFIHHEGRYMNIIWNARDRSRNRNIYKKQAQF